MRGLKWKIGKGDLIDASRRDWFGSWGISNFSTCNKDNQKVASYIAEDRTWKIQEIKRDFLPFEVEKILATMIDPQENADSRYWCFHPKGKYTVKSGYTKNREFCFSEKKQSHPVWLQQQKQMVDGFVEA